MPSYEAVYLTPQIKARAPKTPTAQEGLPLLSCRPAQRKLKKAEVPQHQPAAPAPRGRLITADYAPNSRSQQRIKAPSPAAPEVYRPPGLHLEGQMLTPKLHSAN